MKYVDIKNKQGLTEEEFLKQYDDSIYEKPSLTVDMLIFTVMNEKKENYRKLPEKSLKILLVKRGDHPCIGKWALPGGFVGINESLDEAALRVLRAETNVDDIYMEQLYTWGEVDRDPRTRVISSSYMALVDSSSLSIKAGSDEEDAAWFNVSYNLLQEKKEAMEKGYIYEQIVQIKLWNENEELSAKIRIIENPDGEVSREITESTGIAFDHGKFIEYAISRLRNKIEYTSLAFNLMPELFTLTELQQVYEVIQGKELLAAAFRRKVASMVIETNQFTKDAGHRPSKLFRYNSGWKRNM
ncbi:NrtR DNA-binding winged helix domain-containing protein [Clostridium ljungdahlii]|uniref:Bifunctional NMN adenylyltransferase/Nudix hydrolase n=1 Tax=Clostridium ljungdahlii (strain ATCC 55383 / DSM 13528 / PETC) TaxID=748727 RepID=D8GSZ6_CLOLD|nr:NUDIX domain-containing protein [Clostridium ljungdahlii]ADK14566.1 putative NUDIX hydrolase [Clostridium ljungdahlii DSM 13528]OAA85803.1 Bifunctional NMN adenylyltransferase/Nudix hydrolase [Clostridium ljungdahlii DSM 13528]